MTSILALIGTKSFAQFNTTCQYIISGPAAGTSLETGGTSVILADDAVSTAIPIGFNFQFYGNNYSNVYISSNGFISFDPATPNGCCTGQLLPSTITPNNLIAGFWEDLNPGLGGTISYFTTGTAPNRRFIVYFNAIQHFGGGNAVSFEIKLFENSNVISILNISCPSDGGNNTQGIENIDGTIAHVPSGRNAANFSSTNETVTFTPIDNTAPVITCPSNITVNPDPGSCAAIVSYSSTATDNCSVARTSVITGLASGSSFPVGTTAVTLSARDDGSAGVFSNGAGGTFTFNEGDNPQTIALKACESFYGTGNCSIGACGSFTYYYRTGQLSCNCSKTPGQFEWVYSNSGYTDVGQDYGGTNAALPGTVPFCRVKGEAGCSVPNTWLLADNNIGGNQSTCSFNVTVNPYAAPTAVTASPSSACVGSTILLNGTSAGNNISWFTTPTGGTSLGTSASGANFPTTVTGTTTYYAETTPIPIVVPTVTYTQSFVNGITPTTQCTAWTSFLASLTGTYTKMTFSSDLNAGITLTDPTTINAIANALRTGTTLTTSFGGNTYYVGGCGAGIEFSINSGSICNCVNAYTIRPCIGNSNWGGVNTTTCNGPNQTITLQFSANAEVYTQSFGSGIAPTFQCGEWTNFQASLTGTYNSLSITNNLGGGTTLTDPTTVNAIANAIRTGTTFSTSFGGNNYYVGTCGGTEFSINSGGICGCSSAYVIRPCIGNLNWGGVSTATCGGPSQTITLQFNRAPAVCASSPRTPVTVTGYTLSVAPTAITGTLAICSGSSTTLTVTGGTIGTGALIQWYTGSCGGTLVGTGASISVSPTTSTTYFVRYSGSCNTTSCISATVNVTVVPVPTPVTASPSTACIGSTVQLNATSPGNTINWYTTPTGGSPFATSASGANVAVTPSATTTYYAESTPIPVVIPTVTYSQSFVNGAAPTTQCSAWTSFLASLTGTYTKMTFSSDLSAGITLTDPTTINAIANALRTGTALTTSFGGNTYMVGTCGGIEFSVNAGSICNCTTAYTLRPCIGNANWGGVNTTTCVGPNQTITLQFSANAEVYTQSFGSGAAPTFQCGEWTNFQASLTGTYNSLSLTNNLGSGTTLNDPTTVNAIANAIRTGATFSTSFGGNTYYVGNCGGTEFSINSGGICGCSSAYVIRPCIGNSNWGGVSTATCGGPSQTITLQFNRTSLTCVSTTRTPVTFTGNTLSVAPSGVTGSLAICAGSSTTVTVTGGTKGTGAVTQWFSGSCGGSLVGTGDSIVLTPSSTTTYFVRYNGTCNTTTCASFTITVNPYPVASISPSSATFCTPTSVTFTASGATTSTLANVLTAINSNSATLISSIPTPSGFNMDLGVNAQSISDGCSDMYDGGNFINTNLATSISYSDNTILSTAAFGSGGQYFTRYLGPGGCQTGPATIFYMAADVNGLSTLSITGNNGADGSGTQDLSTFTVSAGGVTYTCFLKRVYSAFDPSINQIFMIPQPNSATQAMGTTTDDNLHIISNLTGVTRVYYMLYAGANGALISTPQATSIAQTFANIIPTSGTYSWSTGATTAPISVTPTSTTTYTCTVTNLGCSTPVSATVTINTPSVAPTSITGTTTICNGSSTTLTVNGGSAGTGATAEWFSGSCGGTPVGTGNSVVVSPTSTTTYFVRYNGTCNTTTCASTTVTVNTLSTAPTSITGTTTICSGASTTLTLSGGSAGTGATAEWFSSSCGGTAVGTGNSISVSPTTTTTYFVRYNGTCNTTTCASTTVTVNTLSVAATSTTSTPDHGCEGTSITLSASGYTTGTGATPTWWTGPTGTGTNVGTGASVVTTIISPTYYMRLDGTCNAVESSVSIAMGGPSNVILASGPSTNPISYCEDGAWTYYEHPSIPGKFVFAVKWGVTNAVAKAAAQIFISNNATAISNEATRGGGLKDAAYVMKRYWNVDLGGNTLVSPVDIKFFYDPSEITSITADRDAELSALNAITPGRYFPVAFSWFKTVGTPFTPALINDGNNFTFPYIPLTPATTGTESGISYVEFDGITSFSGGTGGIGISPNSSTALPVTYTSITAKPIDNEFIQVAWVCASEINNKGFDVLRSLDGINFEKVGFVYGSNNSSVVHAYYFDDHNVVPGREYYYRLNQIDNDGKTEKSTIVSAHLTATQTNIGEFYPNPTQDIATIDIFVTSSNSASIRLIDAVGQEVMKIDNKLMEGTNKISINTNRLASGVYLAYIQVGNLVIPKRIVVSK